MPFPSHNLKGAPGFTLCRFLRFTDFTGVDSVRNLLPCRVSLFPCVGKGDFGIGSERKQFLFSSETVFEAPPLPTIGCNKQIQPLSVGDFVGLIFFFRAFDFYIGFGGF